MQDKTHDALSLFVEKAEKLTSLSFTRSIVQDGGLNLKISWQVGDDLRIERSGPHDEAVDAFVLTFRFFIQNNESISFGSLNDQATNDPGVSNNWKQEFARVRNELNQFLDAPPSMGATLNGQSVSSRREILETFVYGGLAHANAQKRQVFEFWRSDPFTFQFLQFQFSSILVTTLKAISYVAYLSEQELRPAQAA